MKRIFIAFVMLLALAACNKAAIKAEVDATITTADAVIFMANLANAYCDVHTLTEDQCIRANDAYLKAGKAYDAAADALITALTLANVPDQKLTYQERHNAFMEIYNSFIDLAVEFGLIGLEKAALFKTLNNIEWGTLR